MPFHHDIHTKTENDMKDTFDKIFCKNTDFVEY